MIHFRPLRIEDYDDAYSLWRATEGMGLSSADDRAPITRYLDRNPGLSLAAFDGNTLVATALCGHDGRRGYLHHLAVATTHRRQGLGTRIVEACLDALRTEGMEKCHLFVFEHNEAAKAFWTRAGWAERHDIAIFSVNMRAEQGQARP